MPRLETRPFADDDVPEAGRLLAERHRRHRAAEPLLSARYEDPAAATAEVEALWSTEDASGSVAVRDGRAVGFLLGIRKDDGIWGPNAWIEAAGHAAEDPQDARELYASAAAGWVDEGRTRHYTLVPATDDGLVTAWFRTGFGQQHAFGIRKLTDADGTELPDGVREAEARDVDALIEQAPLLPEHQALAPVFSDRSSDEDEDELRREIEEEIADPETGNLVVEVEGQIAGNFLVVPIEQSSMHSGLARPDGASFLGFAVTVPDVRGSGAGLALTAGAFAWARSRGYDVMVTDWRVTNLLASRFWPRRGFRTTFLRLYRSIP